jgi:hypothetical protein
MAGMKLGVGLPQSFPHANVEQVVVWGCPDECAERLRKIVASGDEMPVLTALFDEAEQPERIAADLAPRLEDL